MARKSARTQWADKISKGTIAKKSDLPTGLLRRKGFNGVILGVDPSLRGTGLAVISFQGKSEGQLVASQTVFPPRKAELPECLGCIARAVEEMVVKYSPDEVAIEETIYVQNLRTAQKLGAARGAAIGQAAFRNIPVREYSPLRIKQAVVGFGRASKEQVARQIKALLKLEEELPFDESDAAATAICHAWTGSIDG